MRNLSKYSDGALTGPKPFLWVVLCFAYLGGTAFGDVPRLVPQLGLTSLTPRHLAFDPQDGETLLVVNRNDRADRSPNA